MPADRRFTPPWTVVEQEEKAAAACWLSPPRVIYRAACMRCEV
jgi:hypothetical protein